MKSSLFIVVLSFCLISCDATYKAITYLNKITTPPATRNTVTTTNDYAPANVNGKFLEIGKPNITKFYWECEFNVGNNQAHYSTQNARYTKTGTNTAKVEYVSRYAGEGVFNLKFTSSTGGIVEGEGVSFTLESLE